MIVLGIDPGREKCGLAVVSEETVLQRQVAKRGELLSVVPRFVMEYNVDTVVVGDGTGSQQFVAEITDALPDLSVVVVDERHSTEEARFRYWSDHKAKGWRRLVPKTMQVPPEPYDDYVAVILAERFLAKS